MFSDAMYQNNPLQQKGINTVKKSFSSGSALALIVLYGTVLIISLISFFFLLSNLRLTLAQINDYYDIINYQNINRVQGIVTVIGIIAFAISALPFIGLLIAFVKSKNPSDTSNPGGSMIAIFVSGIINTIIAGILFLLFLISFFQYLSKIHTLSTYEYRYYSSQISVYIFIYIALLFTYLISFLFGIGMALSAYSARQSIKDNILYTKGWKLTRVTAIISACMAGLLALIFSFNLTNREIFFFWLDIIFLSAVYITMSVFITGHLRNIYFFNNGGFVPPLNNTNTYYNSIGSNTYPPQPMANQNYYTQPQQPTANQNYYTQPQHPTANQNYYAQPQQPTVNQNYYAQPQQPTVNQNYYTQPQKTTVNQNYYAPPQTLAENQNYYSDNTINPQPKPVDLSKTVDTQTPVNLEKSTDAPPVIPVVAPTASTEKPKNFEDTSTVCPACHFELIGNPLFCPHCGQKL